MSKLGRYSADRKKIISLTKNRPIKVSDCGTVFVLNSGSVADGTYTASLPSVRAAGNGWWCKFVIGEVTGGDVLISASADDTTSMFVHKPMSRNDVAYGNGAYYNAYLEIHSRGLGLPAEGRVPMFGTNMVFVPQNIASAGSVRFTISSSANPGGCMQDNLSYDYYLSYDDFQPSASCVVNDTLELMTDGVRWYGQTTLDSSVSLLDGTENPCLALTASLTYGYGGSGYGPPPV